jgi:hypothetical protein
MGRSEQESNNRHKATTVDRRAYMSRLVGAIRPCNSVLSFLVHARCASAVEN